MKYVAGYNMSGYLPDDEPVKFDDYNEALEHLAAEIDRFADLGEYSPILADEAECKALRLAAVYFRSLKGNGSDADASYWVFGWEYWIHCA